MPIISVNLTDETYKYVMGLVERTEKKNKSAVVEALLANTALLTGESLELLNKDITEQKTSKADSLNRLIKIGYNYWYFIKPELNK